MSLYRVIFRGQYEYSTEVEADSREEAQNWAEVDLDHAMGDIRNLAINSVHVEYAALQDAPENLK